MSIRIRIDGMKLPEKDKDLSVMIDHAGRVCVGAKIVGRAEYLPSNADSVRAMSDEDLAWLYAKKTRWMLRMQFFNYGRLQKVRPGMATA